VADDSLGPEPGTDDEFDRQLRALTEGLAGEARFHELSAAERAKAGARRAKEARKQAARSARLAERTARRATGQLSTRRRWLLGSLIIVVALAIVSGLFWLSVGRALRGGSGGSQSGRGSTTPTGTPSATSASATSTPAAAGGPSPAAQVADAYQSTGKLFAAVDGALEPWDRTVITNSGIHGCGVVDGYIYSAPVSRPSGGGAACGPANGS
jgi:hypothetical protein